MPAANINRNITFIVVFGLILSSIVFFFLKNWEEKNRFNEFQYKATDHAAAIQTAIEHITKNVNDVHRLIGHDINIELNDPLAPEAFMSTSEKIIIDDPAFLTIAWAVTDDSVQKQHLKVIYLKKGNHSDGDSSDLKLGDDYAQHLGVEIAFNNKIIHTFSHHDGKLTGNELNLVGFVTDASTNKLIGAVIAEWHIDKLVEHALAKLPVAAQDISLSIIEEDGNQHQIYTHKSRSRTADESNIHTGINQTIQFDVSDHHWILEFEAAPQFLRNHPITMAWPSLAFCLLLTFFIAWYTRHIGNQTLLIEEKVTQRTKELNDSNKEISKLATVINQTKEIVIVTSKEGVIEYVNPAFEQISGYSASEAIGNKPNIVKSGKHADKFYIAMWSTLNSGKPWNTDFTNRKKNGELYDVTQSISPIVGLDGDIVGFASVQRDITHQRQLQRRLQHTDRVDSLGVLAGGIAHDFNNLLTAILGNASLAIKKLDAHSPILKHIGAIENASHSAADLCKQMLAYSGKGKFVIKAVSLSDLVENMAKLIDVSLAKNVVLKYYLHDHLPAIDADIAQMQQIILNLITNASEAIDGKSGVISMTTGVMSADLNYLNHCIYAEHTPGRYVYLEISDTGCGMDAATQKKVFDPFFTTKFTGRGLGMSAMLGIVKGHKGALRIYSEVGKGTTIKVAFPMSDATAVNSDKPSSHFSDWTASGTVLIVDDEETIREIATVLLEDIGFDVITANDGKEGVEVFQQHKNDISLVLLDMTMPKMDGVACFSELRKLDPDVKVLLSSGYNEQDATNRFVGKGLAGFIQKPYSAESFTEKVKEALKTV